MSLARRAKDRPDHCLAVHDLARTRRADPHGGFGAVALGGLPGQRLALAVNVAGQPPDFQYRFGPGRPAGCIPPSQQLIRRLAVMHGGISDVITPDQPEFSVRIEVVPVAVVAFAVFPGPARINLLLRSPGGLVSPALRRLIRLDRRVFRAFVVVARHRHD